MKTRQCTGSFQQVYIRLLLCFISSVVFASSAYALNGNLVDACSDCHGTPRNPSDLVNYPGPADIRPNDLGYRNISSGAFVGNHRTHIPALTTSSNVCIPCHGPAPATMDHRDGKINMRQHINSSASVRGFYDKPVGTPAVFFNQTSAPILSTCNSVNCHFRKTTTAWGSALAPGQSEASCAYCHNSSGASSMTTGNHTKHITKFGSTISTCANCHINQTTFAHATSAKAGSVIGVTMAGAPSLRTGGTYAAGTHATYPNYYGVTGYGTCNTVYCHSSAQSLTGGAPPTYKAQTWGVTLTCSGCHGDSTANLLSGSHSKHLNPSYASFMTCGSCHGAGYSSTTVNDPTHVNQIINISLTSGGTYSGDGTPQNSNFGACSTSICHGTNSATWGVSVSNQVCTECHGLPNFAYTNFSSNIIAPGVSPSGSGVDTGGNSAASSPRVGAHQTHLLGQNNISGPMHCGECHFTHTVIQDATHLNFTTATVTYQNAVLAKTASHLPTATRVSGIYNCSSVYCHQGARAEGTAAGQSGFATRTNPVWNDTALIGGTTLADSCTNKCHGLPPNAATSGDTHFNRLATTFSELATNCGGCHSEVLNSPNPTSNFAGIFKDKTKHIDGTVNVVGGNCDGCHHYDTVGSTFSGGKWTGGTWGLLNLGNYSPVSEGWGAHAKHINFIKTRLGIAVALNPVTQTFGVGVPAQVCGTCHNNGATHNMAATGGTDPTGRSITFNSPSFINGAINMAYGATSPTYNGISGTSSATTLKTCSNISCHYFTTPLWSTY